MKKLFVILLSALCLFSLVSCDGLIDVNFSTDVDVSVLEQSENAGSLPEESENKDDCKVIGLMPDDVVVFLGDSIAQGYGLNDVEKERYSSLIAEKSGCTVYNYAVPGDDGADLIELLASGTCTQLEKATVIVISIGANNVLKAADTLLPYYEQIQNGQAPEILDISETFNVIVQGIQRFEAELPQIISDIRAINSDALIVFQTVYNPYRDFTEFKVEQNGLQISCEADNDMISCFGVNVDLNFMGKFGTNFKDQLLPTSPYTSDDGKYMYCIMTRPNGRCVVASALTECDGWKITYSPFAYGHYINAFQFLASFDRVYN